MCHFNIRFKVLLFSCQVRTVTVYVTRSMCLHKIVRNRLECVQLKILFSNDSFERDLISYDSGTK